MTTLPATAFPTPVESAYPITSLTAYYTRLLDHKEKTVAAFFRANPDAGWARNWPQGNTARETLALSWLKAQQENGATLVKTADPLSDGQNALGNPHHTLLMQIQSGRAIAL